MQRYTKKRTFPSAKFSGKFFRICETAQVLRVAVRFDTKPSGFSIGEIKAAITALSQAGSEIKSGRGNVFGSPKRP